MGFEGVENECMGVKEHEVFNFFQKFLNVFMLLLNFILGLNFINFLQISLFLDMVMIIVLKQRKKFKPRIKFNLNMSKDNTCRHGHPCIRNINSTIPVNVGSKGEVLSSSLILLPCRIYTK